MKLGPSNTKDFGSEETEEKRRGCSYFEDAQHLPDRKLPCIIACICIPRATIKWLSNEERLKLQIDEETLAKDFLKSIILQSIP